MSLKKFIPAIKYSKREIFEFQFTVFIPVYNSAHTVGRTLASLERQSYSNFEVIIINDGSTDDSHAVISQLLQRSILNIKYVSNSVNKHKMGCLFEAVSMAKGEFFLILDADDECKENALEVFLEEYNSIADDMKPSISGVTCCCIDQHGRLVGDYFPESPFYCDSFRKKVYYNIKGEKWGFVKTSILSSIYVNEEVFSNGLIPESYIWFLIAKEGYVTKYINSALRVYHVQSEGNLSSLNYNKKAFGMAVFAIMFMNYFHQGHLLRAPKHFLMRVYSLLKASNFLHFSLSDYFASIDNLFLKLVFLLLWPFRRFL